jgi:uncharacterized lipoprotein YddW (UPF0748 family)
MPREEERDLLRETVTEAHRNGLFHVAWFEYGFMAAFHETHNELRRARPQWLLRDRKGNEVAPDGMIWMNPLHPEVRALLLGIVLEAVRNYQIDGVQLDDRLAWPGNAFGYDEYTVAAYAKEHAGRRPPDDVDDPEWVAWRAGKVTEFAEEFYRAVKKARPGIVVSLSPSPWPWSYEHHAAAWVAWAQHGWFDEFVPQVYRSDAERFERDWREQVAAVGERREDLVAGIKVVEGKEVVPWKELARELEVVRASGAAGHCWWFSNGVLENYSKEIAAAYGGWVGRPGRRQGANPNDETRMTNE